MDLTPAAPPIFLKPNYLRESAGVIFGTATPKITITSNAALADRLVDMDPNATWNSTGSSDGNTQTILIPVYVGVTQTIKTDISCIALLNNNFRTFTVELSTDNGATYGTPYSVDNNTLVDYIIDTSASPVSANLVRIVATNTFTSLGSVEKKLGAVVLSGLIYQMLSRPLFPISETPIENVRVLVMADNSKNITYMKRSAASYEFYTGSFKFGHMIETEITAIRSLRRSYPAFIFYPEPGDKKGSMYYSMFSPGSFGRQMSNICKALGNDLAFSIEEIGG